MQLSEWSKMRKTWTTARDAAKPAVKSGAVKGVSVGDSLDAVAKAAGRDYKALNVAATKLVADLDKYTAAIKTKSPALVTWIDANLKKPAKELQTAIAADLKAFRAIEALCQRIDTGRDIWVPADLVRVAAALPDDASLKAARPDEYKGFFDVVVFWRKFSEQGLKISNTFALELPKQPAAKEIKSAMGSIAHNTKVVEDLVRAAGKPGFAMELRPHTALPDHQIMYYDAIQKAAKRAIA